VSVKVVADDAPQFLHFTVSDTGIGIPPGKQRSIFDPFSQADTSTTRQYGGTGLGLTISMRLVELMGGRIWVESHVGQGAQFHFTALLVPGADQPRGASDAGSPPGLFRDVRVPLVLDVTTLHAAARQSVPAVGEPQVCLNLLVAEDNSVNQLLMTRLLEKRGHHVALAANGREAVEAIGKERYDLVFMDMQMPEMDGLEATATIREREKGHGIHLAVIALTAHAMKGDRERCLAAGMDDYLSKPIGVEELDDVLRRYGRGWRARELAARGV
jgi:CheY-like chemotaxis protein